MTCLDETVLIVFEEDLAWEWQAAAVPLLLWASCSALWCAKLAANSLFLDMHSGNGAPFHLKQSQLLFTFSPPWKKQVEYLICPWISPLGLFIQGSVSGLSFSFRMCCFCTKKCFLAFWKDILMTWQFLVSSILLSTSQTRYFLHSDNMGWRWVMWEDDFRHSPICLMGVPPEHRLNFTSHKNPLVYSCIYSSRHRSASL